MLLAEEEMAGWDASRYNAYLLACDAISTGPSRSESPLGPCWMGGVRLVPGMEFIQDQRRVPCYGLRSLPLRPSSIDRLTRDADERHPDLHVWIFAQGPWHGSRSLFCLHGKIPR